MLRCLCVIFIGLCLVCFSACSLSSKFGNQTWSENYALLPGVQATTPSMVDGDLKTVGETALPPGAENAYGMSGSQEAMITLPEVMNVYRVVVHSDNIKKLKILADKGGGDWDLVADVKGIKSSVIDTRISARTDKVRIRVLETSDDGELRRSRTAQGVWGRQRGSRIAPGKIAEIEIYGYASTEDIAQQQETDKAEEQLDALLSK